jgi:amino acid adenylation domain-containing protein
MQTISGFRLSSQQEFLWRFELENSIAQCSILLGGTLQVAELKTAVQDVIDRHGILRTQFRRLPEMKVPVQVLVDRSTFNWQEVDLRDRTPDQQAIQITGLVQELSCRRFNLEQAPLLHSILLKLSVDQHILLVSLPALCADRWTLRNFVQEISHAYTKEIEGKPGKMEVPQYVQFSEWQHQLFDDLEASEGQEYWQARSTIAPLILPFERPFSSDIGTEQETFSLTLDPAIVPAITQVAQQYHISKTAFFLTCWQILLWKLTRKPDVCVGTVCDRRENEAELSAILGPCTQWLPIHAQFTEHFCFSDLLQHVQHTLDDAQEWQEYFVWEHAQKLVNEMGTAPIGFECLQPPISYKAANTSFSLTQEHISIAPFKLKLTCIHSDAAIAVSFDYDPNCFLAKEIKRLARYFQTLVVNVTHSADAKIRDLSVLSQRDRHHLLVELNQTQTNSSDQCIHHLIEAQAEQHPDRIAVVFEDQTLTYAQLNVRANQLAHFLQQQGVSPDVLVGLYLERSLDLIVSLLAILKAGGAYLPLDSSLPTEGVAFRLREVQAPVLLTHSYLVEQLPELTTQVVCLDRYWEIIAQERSDNPTSAVTPEHLSYALFTSGSTGQPKAVAIEHRHLLNYLYSIVDRLALKDCESFATVSTIAADLGNTMIFPALSLGKCLHVIAPQRATDPDAIATYFQRHSIDCLKIVPSHLAALLDCTHPENVLPRKRLILGGEVCPWHLVEQVQPYVPQCRVFNHYGPTETTIGVLTYEIYSRQHREDSATVPIGRPLANTQAYILDEHQHPVPMGVPGELYIGGASVARGYLHQLELTAEKFIAYPVTDHAEHRLYKTGDRVRYLQDGNLEFLGRTDHQVKLRGFRVELGEIEAILQQHPAVKAAIAVVRSDQSSNSRLIAYIVPKSESQTPSAALSSTLRTFLQSTLPDYMVPSVFVVLKQLPLTPNGKVDRQALPTPDQTNCESIKPYVAPRSAIEEQLVEIWVQLLGEEQIGIHDNFFELGGHSLLATQLISRLREAFQIELPLRYLFEAPTIAEFALKLTQQQAEQIDNETLAQTLAELEQLSDDDVRAALAVEQQL